MYSASSTGIEIECDTTNGQRNSTSKIDFRNNIFVGFHNNRSNGYPSGGSGDYSNPIYNGVGFDFFAIAGSQFANNVTYHAKSNWTCPQRISRTGLHGPAVARTRAGTTTDSANVAPLATSAAVMSGAAIPAITIDYAGKQRGSPPTGDCSKNEPGSMGDVLHSVRLHLFSLLSAETWYVRTDGGTRHSSKAGKGQSDCKGRRSFLGTGTNQHCAFNDVRYLWTRWQLHGKRD